MRQPKPWFRSSASAWYVEHHGKQVRLGGHPDGAPPPKKSRSGWNTPPSVLDAFYKLMASDPAHLPKANQLLAVQVCDLFLAYSVRHNEPVTYAWYKHFLQSHKAETVRGRGTPPAFQSLIREINDGQFPLHPGV
jgi:hypothetical protein